jgi:uncharacterized protein YfbU (UPF0304 family)
MTERFEMRLGPSVLENLDAWRATQGDVPSRSEAVRRLVELGLAKSAPEQITLSAGEKLIVIMLCQLFKHLKVKGDVDPGFLEEVIYGGHYWGLDWRYTGLFHGHVDSEAVVSEVVDVLDMWHFLERGFDALSKKDKDRVAAEAGPFGKHVVFAGFDGNGESEHIGVARFLIDRLDRFTVFKGRDLNSHCPSLDSYQRMLTVFEPMRMNLIGRELDAAQIIEILRARTHPSMRKA